MTSSIIRPMAKRIINELKQKGIAISDAGIDAYAGFGFAKV